MCYIMFINGQYSHCVYVLVLALDLPSVFFLFFFLRVQGGSGAETSIRTCSSCGMGAGKSR